jgi:hemoglobin
MSATLYERLGGGDVIRRIVDDAVDAHLKNPAVKTRFEAVADIEHAKEMGAAFFCMGSGGPEEYHGKDLLTAHRGMNISEQEFLAVIDDFVVAMDNQGIGDGEKNEVIAVLYSLKGDVIRV